MAGGFSVQAVEIEGFKGFTSPTAIDFKGRHVFLLGQNGNGKSSIVEAVRWGLFGSAHRQNEVIKNQHYPGSCCVTIKLMRDGELWTLGRTLNLGAGSTSDPTLTDRHGNRRPIREIMPQLDSVDTGEGTHIIFASQSAPLQRQPQNLGAFERTIFNYLGLTHPQALLSNIELFLKGQSEVEDDLGEELTETRKSIDSQISEEETRRSHILNAPPWGDVPAPSTATSEQKTRHFIQEITGRSPSDDLEGLSLDALLESAEESLAESRTRSQGSLEKEAAEVATYRGHLEDLRNIRERITEQASTVESTKAELETIYDGLTSDELRECLEATKYRVATESIKGRIVRDAIDLISRDESEEVLCPICDSHNNRHVLGSTLQNSTDHSKDDMDEVVATLEDRVRKSSVRELLLAAHKAKLRSIEGKADPAMNLLTEEHRRKLEETGDIDELIEQYSKKESVVKDQIDNQETWLNSKRAQLSILKDESRFHRIQRRLNNLQNKRNELGRVIRSYDNLVAFGQSVRKIKEVASTLLSEQLAKDIPRVSETLSKAFSALTQHPWYDRLIVSETTLPKLELRVASSQDATGREDPTGVLNGQAESALNLAPYFAFSQPDDTPTEVYLVMLDDPTRALDTEHTKILVERLRELGRSVQLIVASQETERFLDMIPSAFDEDSYIIIEPTGWSPDSGPNLKFIHA